MSEQVEFLDHHPSLNKVFFEKVLKVKYDTEGIVLKDFTFDGTTNENYGIQITRVKLYYSFSDNENMDIVCSTFMIKTRLIEENASDDRLGKWNVFAKEAVFYLDVLPNLYDLMGEKFEDKTFAPRCFDVHTQGSSCIIVFEDLSKKGYKRADNGIGLDYDHLRICLSKLAKLHAASACYGYQGPPMLNIFQHPMVTSDTSELFHIFRKPIEIFAKTLSSWSGFESISTKLFNLETKIADKVVNLFKPSKFNVLVHGDLWSNNLMYLYDKDERPIDAIMLDYSSVYWTTPAIDIAYLLYSSSSTHVGTNNFDELIDLYHKELTGNLSILNYSGYVPSLDDINEEIKANSVPIIAITAYVNGFRLSENVVNAKRLLMVDGWNFLSDSINSCAFKQRMEFLFNHFDSMTYLD